MPDYSDKYAMLILLDQLSDNYCVNVLKYYISLSDIYAHKYIVNINIYMHFY